MPRQLRASGGITNVVPRTNYFLGGIKRRLRKLIPNELASIAVKAAPFVAPFNPAIGAALAGIGGFDQTGRIGSSLKSAALTYGGGQFARQLGGADLQGNPFTEGGAFRGGLEGLKSGFSSPISSGNVDKIFGKKTVEGISDRVTGGGTEGLLGKLGLTKGGGSLKLTGLGKISAGALASYFVGKGATPEEAKDLTGDVYRGEGIGFDQLIVIGLPTKYDHDFFVRFYNSDSSEASMCLNGIRCASSYIWKNSLAPIKKIFFKTKHVDIKCFPENNKHVSVIIKKPKDMQNIQLKKKLDKVLKHDFFLLNN